jgi:O-antigen/teichoic acid export membrane protein
MLPLESFGYYMLGSRIAACLGVASSPLSTAFFPAFSREVASGNERRLADLYHRGSQLMSVLVLPTALTVIFFAKPLIFAWTGKESVADRTSLIAALLTTGSAFTCIVAIPYALQLAHGWTRLAFWSNLFALFLSIPLLLILTGYFGAAGAASVWLIVNLSYLATDVMPMHRRLLTSEAKRWFWEDVGIPLIACAATAALLFEGMSYSGTRLSAALTVASAASILGGVAVMATPLTRRQIRKLISRNRAVSTVSV